MVDTTTITDITATETMGAIIIRTAAMTIIAGTTIMTTITMDITRIKAATITIVDTITTRIIARIRTRTAATRTSIITATAAIRSLRIRMVASSRVVLRLSHLSPRARSRQPLPLASYLKKIFSQPPRKTNQFPR